MRQSIRNKSMSRGLNLTTNKREIKNLLYIQYKREVEKRKNIFVFSEELKTEISMIGDFLTEENSCYGLFMPGRVGNGKTTMLKAIRNLLVGLIDQERISYCEGDKYPRFVKATDAALLLAKGLYDEFRSIVSSKYLLIDDVGEEPTSVMHYGVSYKPLYQIIDYRYENLLPTFISSNLSADDISKKYEDMRLIDRMSEMFKVVSFKGGSFR